MISSKHSSHEKFFALDEDKIVLDIRRSIINQAEPKSNGLFASSILNYLYIFVQF